ncbi:unnamed protein product [Aureobasidium vineae]|uniref:Uncharacterized protein n=1 Tax=Aureobasidium vineae TaxID=2773715 RepID=A0A9N8JTV8_9PEZI|nr:unnamed protein product [Aureobasidium vineae]
MSSSGSTIQNIKPHDVTAWTHDIEMQMLQGEILVLKKNLTEANIKQIEEKEESIAEKKTALEKHCLQFGMTHGNYGTEKSEHAGAMTNGGVKNGSASADVKMDMENTMSIDAAADAAASAALDEIKFPESTAVDIPNNIDVHQKTGMAVSHEAPVGVNMNDPFIAPADHSATTAGLFHASTGTYHSDPFGPFAGGYAPAHTGNDPFINQNVGHTGSTAQPTIDINDFLNENGGEVNYTTSGGLGDAGMGFGEDEMDMDTMATHTPMPDFEEPVIPGMEKYDNL